MRDRFFESPMAWVAAGMTAILLGGTVQAANLVLIDEDFETDLSAWEEHTLTTGGLSFDDDRLPTTLSAPGDAFGGGLNYPGSQAIAYQNSEPQGSIGRYVTIKFPGAVAPGTYRAEIEADIYSWSDNSDAWRAGNYILILTDNAYDNLNYVWDGNDGGLSGGDYFGAGLAANDGMDPEEGIMVRSWHGWIPFFRDDDLGFPKDLSLSGVWNRIRIEPEGTVFQDVNLNGIDAGDDVTADLDLLAQPTACTQVGGVATGFCNEVITQSGDIEIRLLMFNKGDAGQSAGWDNLTINLYDPSDLVNPVWTFSEDFETPDPLAQGWEGNVYLPYHNIPRIFEVNDPLLLGDTGSPGSKSFGYAEDRNVNTPVNFAWISQKFPSVVNPGTYTLRVSGDRYVRKDNVIDPYRVGNRTYFLYDSNYDNDADFDPDTDTPEDGISSPLWPGGLFGVPDVNGVWQQYGPLEEQFTTTTGNLEFRLSLHDKSGGPEAVAWDNILVELVSVCNVPRFDSDDDGDVDGVDFANLQLCLTDSGITEECICFNANTDDALNAADISAFLDCAMTSGPSVPVDPSCEDGLAFPGS